MSLRPRSRPDFFEAKGRTKIMIVFVLELSSRSRTDLEDCIPENFFIYLIIIMSSFCVRGLSSYTKILKPKKTINLTTLKIC